MLVICTLSVLVLHETLLVPVLTYDERIDEGVLQWFGLVERIEMDRITKTVFRRV